MKLATCWECGRRVRKYSYDHMEQTPHDGLAWIICNKCRRRFKNE